MLPEGYRIHRLFAADGPALTEAYRRNRAHLEPWEPRREESFFTVEGQTVAILAQLETAAQGLVVPWLLTQGQDVVGRVNLNNVVMGVLRSASIGYWVDEQHTGRGLASGAVGFACEQAARRGLHRLEAGTLVHNVASQRVLERSGFEYYGLAPKFLFIAGDWRDHRLYQRILHDRPI